MTNPPLTPQERAAISALEMVASKWPSTLWLFSASGPLTVMRCSQDGKRIFDGETYDQAAAVAVIDIPNDGGDF